MRCIVTKCDKIIDNEFFEKIAEQYSVKVRDEIRNFLTLNSGGYPIKDVILVDGEEYEVRVFLSLNTNNSSYSIEKPLQYFMEKTENKIIPIGIDSGDNYYCVNNEDGKVYYWSSEQDNYYCIADSLQTFILMFI